MKKEQHYHRPVALAIILLAVLSCFSAQADCINGVVSVCPGETQTYTLNPGTFMKASYSYTGGTKIAGGTFTSNYITITWNTPGSHTLLVEELHYSNSGFSCSLGITVGAVAGGTVSPANTTICQGSSASLSLSGHSGSVQRWEKTTNGSTWQTISHTSTSYNTGALSATTTFRAVVSRCSSTAYSSSATVTVSVPNAGSVSLSSGTTSFCSGESASGTLVVSGHSGIVGTWQKSVYSGGVWGAWTSAGGGHDVNYFDFSVNVPTRFRATISSGTCGTLYTNHIEISSTPAGVAGSISGPSIVCSGQPFSLSLNGNVGSVVGWYKRTVNGSYGGAISPINTTITQPTYFKAKVQKPGCSSIVETAEFYVNVYPAPQGGTLSSNATICQGGSHSLALSGYAGSILRWEKSTNDGSTWQTISHTNSAYNTGALSTTTKYRVITVNSCGVTATSTSVTVMVSVPNAGTMSLYSGTTSFCSGESASGTLVVSGHSGIVGTWQKSVYSGGVWGAWTSAGGGHDVNYFDFSVNVPTRFRATISSGTCGTLSTNHIEISSTPAGVAGSISGPSIVCSGQPFSLSLNGNVGSVVGWYKRTVNGSYGGAISPINTTIVQPTYFKAKVQKPGCSSIVETAEFYIDVYPAPQGGALSSNATICQGGSHSLALSGYAGSILRWEKSTNDGSTWQTISHTTSAYNTGALSTTTKYRVITVNSCGVTATSTSVTVTVEIPTPGTLSLQSGIATFCSGESASGTLEISGHSGAVGTWQKSVYNAGTWEAWTSAGGGHDLNYFDYSTTLPTRFRVSILSGTCGTLYSDYVQINETAPTTAGYITGPSQVCAGSPFNLTLNSNVGTVVGWYVSNDTHTWTSLSSPSGVTINFASSFKAVVQNGNCLPKETPVFSVTIKPAPTIGTLTPELLEVCDGANMEIDLSAFTGVSVQWQKRPDGADDFSTIQTNTNLSFSEPAQTAEWRAVAANECGITVASSIVKVRMLQNPAPPANATDMWLFESSTAKLRVAVDHAQNTVNWYADPQAEGTPLATGLTFDTPPIFTPTTYYARAVNPTGCMSEPLTVESKLINTFANPPSLKTEVVRVPDVSNDSGIDVLPQGDKHTTMTYFDGMGRTLQNVAVASAPSGNDMVQPFEYDKFGRTPKQYLPYAGTTNDGSFRSTYVTDQQNFYAAANDKIADDTDPYSIAVFEESPLERLVEQGAPGAVWQPGSGHTTTVSYSFNTGATANIAEEVRLLDGDGNSTAFFAANTLYRTETTGPDGNKTITFTDSRGRTVAKKQQLDEMIDGVMVNWLETYYIYDALGQLTYIISPKGVAKLKSDAWVMTGAVLDNYVHQFVYDNRGRVIEKKVPGKSPVYTVFDKLNRVVLVQDGLLRQDDKWLFVKYDKRGRAVMNGLYLDAAAPSRQSMQIFVDDLYADGNVSFPADAWYESKGSAMHGYTNASFPKQNADGSALEVLNVNYYDNYDFDFNGSNDHSYTPQGLTGEGTALDVTYGLPTGSKRLVLESASWLYSYVFYDTYHRPIQVRSNNHLSGVVDNLATTVYDFEGKVLETRRYHNAGPGRVTTVLNKFVYDDTGRLKEILQNNNNAPSGQLLVRYEYNELGQLVDKKLHQTAGTDFLQSVDYRYTLHGQLSSINNAELNSAAATNDETNDYFGMQFLYNALESGLNNGPAFNGNISAMKWKAIGADEGATAQKSYNYEYDNAGKLLSAAYKVSSTTGWDQEAGALNEAMTYDRNGNIATLARAGRSHVLNGVIASYTAESIDALTYTYDNAVGDRLDKVQDAATARGFNNGSSGTSSDYAYDAEGNLIADENKDIDEIEYNFLGKVSRIEFTDGRIISYDYDAAGNKIRQRLYEGATLQNTTDYVDGFVYENGNLSFFGSPEGRVVKNGTSLEYQYAIADHQGNTRVVFTSVTPAEQDPETGFESDPGDLENFPSGGNLSSLPLYNQTTGGTHSQLLNGGNNSQVGVGKSFAVFPGDKVRIEAYAKYESGGSSTNASFALALLNAFTLAPPAPTETGTASAALDAWGAWVDGGIQSEGVGPQASVNIVIFDKDYNFLDAAWDVLDPNAEQVGVSPDVAHDQMLKEYLIKEPGFVYLYVSNNSPVNVYFDDVKITHTPTNVIQYNEYYPFGLQTSNSWTRENSSNNFLYNAGTELNSTAGIYETMFRGYDPALGRFLQVDPLASMYASHTPYKYGLNNPVNFNDPSGANEISINNYVDIDNIASGGGAMLRSGYNRKPRWGDTRGQMYNDAAAVRGGQMGLDEYTSKYGMSVSPVNYNNYLYPDEVLVTVVIGQNGHNYGYNIILNLLGSTTFVNRAPVDAKGSGWYETGVYRTLFDKTGRLQQDLAGGWTDWLGVALDAGDDVMAAVGANFNTLQAESNALRHGLNFGKEISKVNTTTTTIKWAGRALGAYNAYLIDQKFNNGELSQNQMLMEQGTNAFSTFGGLLGGNWGLYGASWGLGWEIGRAITTIPGYQTWKHDTWLPWRKENLGY